MVITLKKTGLPALLPVLLAAALLAGCQPGGQLSEREKVAAAEEAVIAHHDTLMARTGRLYEAREQLATAAKAAAGAPAAAQVPATLRSLEAARRAMMNWMHQYQAPDSAAPAAQRLAYFQGQETQLAAVERRLDGALDSARAVLHQLQPGAVAQKGR